MKNLMSGCILFRKVKKQWSQIYDKKQKNIIKKKLLQTFLVVKTS